MSNLPQQLNFTNSAFAIKTMQERWPVILTQVIDSLYRNSEEYVNQYGVTPDQLKSLTGDISTLRYELSTNKPLKLLKTNFMLDDVNDWNNELTNRGVSKELDVSPTSASDVTVWNKLPWLFTECYLYRRINELIYHNGISTFDPFLFKKKAVYEVSVNMIEEMLNFSNKNDLTDIEAAFAIFIQVSLWANEFDLSLHTGSLNEKVPVDSLEVHVKNMQSRLVVDDLEKLWQFWSSRLHDARSASTTFMHTTAIVLDNTGPELVADLCLAEFLLTYGLTNRVWLYPKSLPWFVSDVTRDDIEWLLQQYLPTLRSCGSFWSEKWTRRFLDGSFKVKSSSFWTLPNAFDELCQVDEELYTELSEHVNVIIFKGDLNYRKILTDRSWTPADSKHKVLAFKPMQLGRDLNGGHLSEYCRYHCGSRKDTIVAEASLLGDPIDCRCRSTQNGSAYWGSPLILALRVAKADVAVGLRSDRLLQLQTESSSWWTIGFYGMIQLISPIRLN